MAMWDRLKDQARNLQQSRGGQGVGGPGAVGRGAAGQGHGSGHGTGSGSGSGSGGGTKAQLVGLLKSQLASAKAELKSGAYRDASMAMCALVAAADGHVDPSERQRMESMIVDNDVLRNFPPEQLRQRFNRHVDRLTADFRAGRAEALQEIAKAARKPAEARAVVQTGIVIAGADGHIDQSEQQAVREACAALGLSAAEFGM
ncbi:tellurite resistance TerB family protein [Streptomyces chitinivorans]|uniref:Tellurite resistance TerB family protein n=1 Tax=Streptomyces chitinivorans TaxID=1257027 RepID=A0ABW7HMX0_9ACTN|nr:TerB family tellurite resistance protein [Streptomyces chitinivorans]MDH2407347.1 TerB family tellurite resistance protein [Streptomyces chitinivorans]